MPGEASRRRKRTAAKAGADLRGEVLLTLARLRLATPLQLKTLLLPHQRGTDHVRRALRNLRAEAPALVGRICRAQQSYWYCTPAGLAGAAASGELAPSAGRTTGKRIAAGRTGLREHGLALVDTVIAFHQAQAADHTDWQVEVAHPTPTGNLVPDGVVLLADGSSAFVEIDRTMSYPRLIEKLERYHFYRNAVPSGRGNAARPARSHWQETSRTPSAPRARCGRCAGQPSRPPDSSTTEHPGTPPHPRRRHPRVERLAGHDHPQGRHRLPRRPHPGRPRRQQSHQAHHRTEPLP
nr:replication-relaxation family protein [Streptomyces sp. SID4919]